MSLSYSLCFGTNQLNMKKSQNLAVTHANYSAWVQTLNLNTYKRYYDLIKKLNEKTNCPILINTSFNVRREPILNTPTDLFDCCMGIDLDYQIIGNCILDKNNQDSNLKKNYKNEFELD